MLYNKKKSKKKKVEAPEECLKHKIIDEVYDAYDES